MSLIYPVTKFKGITNSNYLQDRIYNLLDETFVLPKNGFEFNLFVVTKEYIARPDLIALDAYNDPNFADIICKVNGISNPFELNEGMEIIIPTMSSLSEFYIDRSRTNINLDSDDDIIFNEGKTDKSKRNIKRKANEAVIGDSRFKIDAAGGIIIY